MSATLAIYRKLSSVLLPSQQRHPRKTYSKRLPQGERHPRNKKIMICSAAAPRAIPIRVCRRYARRTDFHKVTMLHPTRKLPISRQSFLLPAAVFYSCRTRPRAKLGSARRSRPKTSILLHNCAGFTPADTNVEYQGISHWCSRDVASRIVNHSTLEILINVRFLGTLASHAQ